MAFLTFFDIERPLGLSNDSSLNRERQSTVILALDVCAWEFKEGRIRDRHSHRTWRERTQEIDGLLYLLRVTTVIEDLPDDVFVKKDRTILFTINKVHSWSYTMTD